MAIAYRRVVTMTAGGLAQRHDGAQQGVKATKSLLSKVFLILDCFRNGEATLTLTELANRSGVPKSTVHRLAGTLVESGVLERSYGEFRLGLRLFELGGMVPRWHIVRETALPFMEDLFETTHETIHLGILDGSDVVYLDKIRGHRAPSIVSRCGGRLPAHCTGLGKVLLAFAPAEAREAVLSQPLTSRTPHTITMASVLRTELDNIAARGFAVDREEATLGLQCVAAPVLNPRGHSVAALSVTVPTARFDAERLAPTVRTAALGLSRALAPSAYII